MLAIEYDKDKIETRKIEIRYIRSESPDNSKARTMLAIELIMISSVEVE
jgi:hypothetical protein